MTYFPSNNSEGEQSYKHQRVETFQNLRNVIACLTLLRDYANDIKPGETNHCVIVELKEAINYMLKPMHACAVETRSGLHLLN